MNFSKFATKMATVLGAGKSTSRFTRSLFDAIVSEKGIDLLEKSSSSYKAYYNGTSGISGIARDIVPYCDTEQFCSFIMEDRPDSTIVNLCDAFRDEIPDINPLNAGDELAILFMDILREAAGKKREHAKPQYVEDPLTSTIVRNATPALKILAYAAEHVLDAPEIDLYEGYLNGVKEHYNLVKTILYQERLVPFYEIYICNDVVVYNDSRRIPLVSANDPNAMNSKFFFGRHHYQNITASDLMALTHYGILRGTGGIGKSMMMRHLLFTAIEDYSNSKIIPVIIPLKGYNNSNIDLLDFIVQTIRQFDSQITVERITQDLENGRFLLLLDGLDEIASKYMVRFEESIGKFVNQYKKNYFIISSRPISDFVSYNRFLIISLQELKKAQALELVDRIDFRPDDPDVKKRFRNALDITLFNTHYSFASNPLLLNIMLLTFERYADVPSKMHKFYEKAYEALSQTHDATKGAFIRTFETGFDSDRFEEYLAEFCARTYMAEEYKITVRKAREHYYKMDVRDEYGDTERNFHAFMRDICDNLCLMYCEREEYNFMHRSFQEYFCALYFSRRRESDLARIGGALQTHGGHQAADRVFDMLYDMIPDRVEELIILPHLKKLFDTVDGYDGYWSFLIHTYHEISYSVGDTDDSEIVNMPWSFIYRFIATKIQALYGGFAGLSVEFPGVDDFKRTDYTKAMYYDDDGGEYSEIVCVDILDDSIRSASVNVCGSIYSFRIAELRNYMFDPDSDRPESADPDNWENYVDEIGEIIREINSKDFQLRIEYEKMRDYLHELEKRVSRRSNKKSFF